MAKLIRVLVVDDHPAIRMGIRARLEVEPDLEVVGDADNGEKGLIMCQQLFPDVMLLDMQMPVMTGVEVVAELHRTGAKTRIIALSAYDDEEFIFGVLDKGASGYLMKKEPMETVIKAVRGVMRDEGWWLSDTVRKRLAQGRTSPVEQLLSEREQEILVLMARGFTNAQISESLFVSVNTIKTHVSHVLTKLEVKNRSEAASWAYRNQLV